MSEEQKPLMGDFAEDSAPDPAAAQTEAKKKVGFSSKLGFVLAAAGSAVGLGNLWRFPYLAAKYGGGMFLLCYILLAVTFGFSLLVLEIAIGRKTGKSVIGAFKDLNQKFKWFGFFCIVVPIIIVPYYSVIGGWVVPLAAFAFVAATNCVNLTDGLDGLAASVCFCYFAVLAALIWKEGEEKEWNKSFCGNFTPWASKSCKPSRSSMRCRGIILTCSAACRAARSCRCCKTTKPISAPRSARKRAAGAMGWPPTKTSSWCLSTATAGPTRS